MNNSAITFLLRMQEFQKSEEFLIYKALRKLRLGVTCHKQNYRSLMKSIAVYHLRGKQRDFHDPEHPLEKWRLQRTITTDILNYLGSVGAMIYVNRAFTDTYFKEIKSQLEAKRRTYISDDIEFAIVKKLRDFIVHVTLFDVGVSITMRPGQDLQTMVFVDPKKLIERGSWNKDEKAYLHSILGNINIEVLVKRHHPYFIDTQNKIFMDFVEQFRPQLYIVVLKMKALTQEAKAVNHLNSLPLRPAAVRYVDFLLKKTEKGS